MAPDPFQFLSTGYGAAIARLGIASKHLIQCRTYLNRLWTANQNLNLVSRKLTPITLVENHLFDSLIGLPHLPAIKTAVDLGTGGGFPVVPLAICRPEVRFTCFEKSPQKQRFLESLTDLCPNLTIRGLFEPAFLPQETQVILARGFKSLSTILNLTHEFYQTGGRYVLYKGRKRTIEGEIQQSSLRRGYRIVPLDPIGDAEERHLVMIGF